MSHTLRHLHTLRHFISVTSTACSLLLLGTLVFSPRVASATTPLPDLPGPDVVGQARVIVHLTAEGPLIEIGNHLYTLEGRPLEIGVDADDDVTLLFVLPTGAAGLFVSEEGQPIDMLAPSPTSKLLAYDILAGVFEAAGAPLPQLEFEVRLPGQPAPTLPDIIVKPTDDDPEPPTGPN